MTKKYEETWETYVGSWKVDSADAKQAIFAKCLDTNCIYMDPVSQAEGWQALSDYMLEFHKQVPGGHFETQWFCAHHNRSIARWDMKNGDGEKIGEGVSYGEYNDAGKLVAMTGFFDLPA